MRKSVGCFLIFIILSQFSCSSTSSGNTARVVKPKYHHRWYDRKNDKRVKRTKVVKVKS
jgi:hypothetical protein